MRKAIIWCILIGAHFYCVNVRAEKEYILNTPNINSPSPRVERLINYTINAKRGEIIKKDSSNYELIIYDAFENITYNTSHDSESVKLSDFLNVWKRSGSSNVETDIAGIQVNNLTFGHVQFYASALLTKPRKMANKVSFTLVPVSPLNMRKNYLLFDNATLFINGCNICNCGTDENINVANCIKK